MKDQNIKKDAGKPELTLVPTQIIEDIARVRMFGNQKYKDPDSWRRVEPQRYRDAAFRHLIKYINDPYGVDEESGLSHLSHLACNIAFLCELEKREPTKLSAEEEAYCKHDLAMTGRWWIPQTNTNPSHDYSVGILAVHHENTTHVLDTVMTKGDENLPTMANAVVRWGHSTGHISDPKKSLNAVFGKASRHLSPVTKKEESEKILKDGISIASFTNKDSARLFADAICMCVIEKPLSIQQLIEMSENAGVHITASAFHAYNPFADGFDINSIVLVNEIPPTIDGFTGVWEVVISKPIKIKIEKENK